MVKVDDMKHVAEVEEVIKSYGYETNSMESIRKPIEEQARSQQMILGGWGPSRCWSRRWASPTP